MDLAEHVNFMQHWKTGTAIFIQYLPMPAFGQFCSSFNAEYILLNSNEKYEYIILQGVRYWSGLWSSICSGVGHDSCRAYNTTLVEWWSWSINESTMAWCPYGPLERSSGALGPPFPLVLVLGQSGCNYLFSLQVKATVRHLMHAKSTLNVARMQLGKHSSDMDEK